MRSPEQDSIVATYMRALAEVASRRAELRIKARVGRDSLEAARAYLSLTEDALGRIESSSSVTLNYRIEILRERAQAQKAVASQEAEVAEATTQLAGLDKFAQEIQDRLDEVNRNFAGGRVTAPTAGIISTGLAHAGQSLVAGMPIAEILDPVDVYVDWYIPNERMADPKVGQQVSVLFGNRRISRYNRRNPAGLRCLSLGRSAPRRGASRDADCAHSFRPGRAAARAEFDGLRSHVLHATRRPHRRRDGRPVRA